MLHALFHLSLISAALLDHCNQFFIDSLGRTCEEYDDDKYCKKNGDYGKNWNNASTFEDYAVDNETALHCPQCGCTDEFTSASDPYAVLYEDGRVHEIYITMDPDEWTELRNTTADIKMVNDDGECFKEPLGTDYQWYRANITWNGETLLDCGVRKKGFFGSVMWNGLIKPSIKIDTDQFVDDQEFGGWLERFTLNNNVQFYTKTINQCLAYRILRNMDVSAPRCNFAKVWVNNEYKGLYSNVEPIKKAFLRHNFNDYDDGNLYEGAAADFETLSSGVFEKKNNELEDDWSDIKRVIEALDAGSYEDLAEIIDIEKFVRFWCGEVIVGHVDGYANNMNNFYAYVAENGKFEFIPWGADLTFTAVKYWDSSRMSLYRSVMVQGRIAHFLYTKHQNLFVNEMQTLLSLPYWNVTEIITWATELTEIAVKHGPGYDYGSDTWRFLKSDYEYELAIISNWISFRRDILLDELLPTPVAWETEWFPMFYNSMCSQGYSGYGGRKCTEVDEYIYYSEVACGNKDVDSFKSSPGTAWANNCDEVAQVFNDHFLSISTSPTFEWDECNPVVFGLAIKYECNSSCDGGDGSDAGEDADTVLRRDAGEDADTVLIVCSVIGGVLILLIVVLYCCYSKKKKQLADAVAQQQPTTGEGATEVDV